MGYSPRSYWDGVGERLARRVEGDRSLAGEASPFYAVKRSMFLARLLAPAIGGDDQTVLEVGCGPGGNLEWLEERGVPSYGLDLSGAMLQAARRRGSTRLVQGDASAMAFASEAFDTVITVTVLQHNDDAAARSILTELARVAKSRLHLFEDTGSFALHDRASHWLRKPDWYRAELGRLGYRFEDEERLPLASSELMANGLRALARRHQSEGAVAPDGYARLEAGLLGVTRLLDGVVPPVMGLTRLSFTSRRCW